MRWGAATLKMRILPPCFLYMPTYLVPFKCNRENPEYPAAPHHSPTYINTSNVLNDAHTSHGPKVKQGI